ncbi:MAG: hypothetical protein WDO56_03630 [Gammaproteobacteria bacterium]
MKLRIKGDSLRLRLTKGEVSQLDSGGTVEDQVRFGDGAALIYRLRTDARAAALTASFAQGAVEIRVPAEAAHSWANSNEVTLAGAQPISAAEELRIMVEKDFACLAPRENEDESDNFENPTVDKTC